MNKYVLEGKVAVPCPDTMKWAKTFEATNRTVARDEVGGARVSTIFIGIDHSFGNNEAPLLFETMIFGGPHDQWQERCSTWEQAEEMHKKAVALVRGVEP